MSTNFTEVTKCFTGANRSRSDAIAFMLATGFYSGFSRYVPGTTGSAVWLALWWLASAVLSSIADPFLLSVGAVVSLTFLSLWSTERVLDVLRQHGRPTDDPQFVVIDEWAGLAITLLGASSGRPGSMILAFVLFRIFDMSKPYPIKKLEALPGAVGVVVDDLAAGFMALLVLLFLGLVLA